MFIIEEATAMLQGYIPNLAETVLVLVIGYMLARIGSTVGGKIMTGAGIDKKIAAMFKVGPDVDVEKWAKTNLFYALMFFVLVAAMAALGFVIAADLFTGMALIVILIVVLAIVYGLDLGEKIEAALPK